MILTIYTLSTDHMINLKAFRTHTAALKAAHKMANEMDRPITVKHGLSNGYGKWLPTGTVAVVQPKGTSL